MFHFPSQHIVFLSNDPGKVDSNFFCCAASLLSPHRNVLIYIQKMHKPTGSRLRHKMQLHSHFKGFFYVLKGFDQSQVLKTIAKKSLQCYMFPTYRISVLFKLRPDFVLWEMVGK